MKKIPTLIIASLSCITAAQGATSLLVDFSTGAGLAAETGWESISGTGAPNGTFSGYTDLASGDITVSLSNIAFDRLYRNGTTDATPDDIFGTALDSMYGDLLFRNNASADVDVTISGLKAGTFTITTHHMTAPVTTASTFDYLVQDADSASFSQNEGNFAMGQGNTTTFNPTIVTFEVVSNGSDDIILRLDADFIGTGGNTGGWYGFNGMEIDEVPEPSSTALIGLGGLALILRRRK